MDAALALCERLCDIHYFRRVILYASNRTGWLSRTLFGDRLSQLVYNIKIEQLETLDELFQEDIGFWDMFASGRTLGFESKVVPWLDFSTAGRVTASLSLLAHVVDNLDKRSDLSRDFILDAVCAPVCCRLKTLISLKRLQGLMQDQLDSRDSVMEEVD